MDFGIFMEFEIRHGGDQATAFREGFDVVDAAEAWGLDGVWLGEMHFTPARSVLSAPIVVASSIATRTKRLRIGMAVQVLPLNNPLRIAEEAATVDQISAGRFDFGIGRSGFPRVYDVYGIPYAESQARFREALEIILEAWKGEPFSYKGQYWSFENATVAPRPYQLPHPPLRMAATTEETFPRVGEMGLPIFVGLRGMDISTLRNHVLAYRQAWRAAGHAGEGNVYLRIPVYAADTEKAALEEPFESASFWLQSPGRSAADRRGRTGAGPAERLQARVERLAGLSYEQIPAERVAFGSAAGLIDRFARLREELSSRRRRRRARRRRLIPPERVKRSLAILTREVMPAFK
jgi:alkanesulfonate monooxygenase SsuD/methylene tetrahydromethanopterin reductase-like flavin-dependent oxidoreductase (luciferase family)